MQRSVPIVLVLAFCLTAGACRRSSTDEASQVGPDPQQPRASGGTETADLGGFLIAAPVSYRNLAIFPVLSKVPKTEDRYITLEEGLKAGTVEIYEVGADGAAINPPGNVLRQPETEEEPGQDESRETPNREETQETPGAEEVPMTTDQEAAQVQLQPPTIQVDLDMEQVVQLLQSGQVSGDVNRLMVLNTSGRPLYLMPGEVIYGGKQDRTIAEETIILASNEPQPIDVYCVERGRWSGRTETASVDALMVLSDGEVDEETAKKLAAEANRGKFVASAGNLSKKSRLAVREGKGPEAQGRVWDAVGAANTAADIEVQSGAFTANYATAEVVDQLKPYMEKLQGPVAGQKQVVGAIVAVNGKVESVDIFGSTPLFKKLWPKLLKSHVLDAANAADAPQSNQVCTLEDAQKFLGSAMQADVEDETEAEGGLVVTKRDSQGVVSFSASVAPADASDEAVGAMGMGGFGGSVHSSAFAK